MMGELETTESNEEQQDMDSLSGQTEALDQGKGESSNIAQNGRVRAPKDVKTRLVLSTREDHLFSKFLGEVKKRGLKNFDPSTIIVEALDLMDEQWWDERLEELTPLEFKVTAALSDPKMREKLTMLLASQKINELAQTIQ